MMIADTDVLIDFLQDDQPVARRIEIELERGQLSTTAVTRFELLAGARTTRQQGLIAELLAALPCLLCLRLQRGCGVRGWGREGLGTGRREGARRARRALMSTSLDFHAPASD